ncbi:MAG: adenylate cyclase [Pseudonocardiales bacterium]|nr:adenylate cyclase [Pseudonocardiales bacterium]
MREAIDTIMLGAPPRYGWRRFLELTGLDEHQTRDHRRALGFPYVGDDETPFTDHDVDSAQLMATFTGRG